MESNDASAWRDDGQARTTVHASNSWPSHVPNGSSRNCFPNGASIVEPAALYCISNEWLQSTAVDLGAAERLENKDVVNVELQFATASHKHNKRVDCLTTIHDDYEYKIHEIPCPRA